MGRAGRASRGSGQREPGDAGEQTNERTVAPASAVAVCECVACVGLFGFAALLLRVTVQCEAVRRVR